MNQEKNGKQLFVLTNRYLAGSLKIHLDVLKADMALHGLFENSEIKAEKTLYHEIICYGYGRLTIIDKRTYIYSNIIKAIKLAQAHPRDNYL